MSSVTPQPPVEVSQDSVGSPPTSGVPRLGGWAAVVVLLTWLGGLIGWFVLKGSDRPRARHVVKWGLIWTGIWIAAWVVLWIAFFAVVVAAGSGLESTDGADDGASAAVSSAYIPTPEAPVPGGADQFIAPTPEAAEPSPGSEADAAALLDSSLFALRECRWSAARSLAEQGAGGLVGERELRGNAEFNIGVAYLGESDFAKAEAHLVTSLEFADAASATQIRIRAGVLAQAREFRPMACPPSW